MEVVAIEEEDDEEAGGGDDGKDFDESKSFKSANRCRAMLIIKSKSLLEHS